MCGRRNNNGILKLEECRKLQERVDELEETLRAIRAGEIDAVVVQAERGDQVFTLQGAEHPYRLLVETIDEGAATLTEDGTVLYSNKSFAGIFGVPLERFIGTPLRELISGEDQQVLDKLLSRAKSGNVRGEIRLRSEDGRARTVRLTLSSNRQLGLEAVCAVATELTELVETNEALRATEASLRQLSGRLLQMQDDERRRIARDLHDTTGQKIALLSMTIDQLARSSEAKKPEMRNGLKDVREMVRGMGEEIRTLSYLLHPPLLDECGLQSAVRWYAEGFEKRSGIKLHVDVSQNLNRLPIDAETALFRVLQESLTNVHRYSGSPSAEIHIARSANQVRLEVVDHGKGRRGNDDVERSPLHGNVILGVGIPGMRERLRQLGGSLEVVFGPDGTRVVAVLPLKKVEAQMNGDGEASVKPASEPAQRKSVAENGHGARRRILIADDHEVMRRGLRGLIESQDEWAVCGEAIEGVEAVRKTRELHPDLVILDINMPGLSGLDAAQQIRRENALTRVLFFTVHDSEQMMREIASTGAQGYVSKARAGQDLVEAVRSVLRGGTFFPNMAASARNA
jgi:PAS domain S-box-containing protein